MYSFDILETRNSDEWFAIIVATEAGTGKQWELLDTVVWMPTRNADDIRWELEALRDTQPQEPGEYWQEL